MGAETRIDSDRPVAARRSRRVGIIGAGPGGICAAVQLKAAGYDDVTIWEKSDNVGGTWYNNRYPGLACDVASHLYSFSFDLNPSWSRAFAPQPEILEYVQGAARRHDILRHVQLSTEVVAVRWDDSGAVWHVEFSDGGEAVVDVLISALGMFNLLKWPEIDGRDSFEGRLFHSARWPDDVDLAGKRVAVIGTAASSVQMVPVIAREVTQLDVYQRTPSWVLPKDDPVFEKALLDDRQGNPLLVEAERARLYAELDEFVKWDERVDDSEQRQACVENISVVEDLATRAALTPDFNWGCARPLFSNEYYPAFNRGNVDLIARSIRAITPSGIEDADGVERPYDIIICATGYQVDKFMSAIEVRGRAGRRLAEAWADGAQAYLGISTTGFPNLFMSYGPNTNNGSLIFMAECEAEYIVRHIAWMDENEVAWMDIRPEAEDAYNEKLQKNIGNAVLWQGACSNYYFGKGGKIVTQFPLNMTEYKKLTDQDDWHNFEVHHEALG